MDYLNLFAENVRYYRKRLGITQAQLADKLNYDQSSIAKIEAGKVDLPQSKVLQLAEVLDCSPWDLIPSTNESKEEERQRRLMRYASLLSEEYFKKLEERAEELVELSKLKGEEK